MKTIPLTNSPKLILVSDEDHEKLSKSTWFLFNTRGKLYARHTKYPVFMHECILLKEEGKTVDHEDCNTFNNQRSNLRLSTTSQNQANRGKTKANSSGYKGVFPQSGKWKAAIRVEGKQIYLGFFVHKMDAAIAYDKAAIKYFGEFANTNFSKVIYEPSYSG